MAGSEWLRAVGVNLLMARTHAKKKQSQLGVSPTTVAKLEDGGGGNLGSIEKIAAALAMSPLDLLTYPVRSVGEHVVFLTEVARMFSDPSRRRLMHRIGSLKDDHLEAFEDYCEKFDPAVHGTKARDRLQRRPRR